MAKEKMNLPNKITISRICLIPLIFFFYIAALDFGIPFFYSWGKAVALGLYILATVTDFLDGYLARKNGQVTNLGKLLDPMADKMLTTTGLVLVVVDTAIMMVGGGLHFVWFALAAFVLVVCISRDFLNSAIRQVGAEKGKIFAAVWSGKIRTNVVFFTTMFMMFLGQDWNTAFMSVNFNIFWTYLCIVGLIACIFFNIYSAIDYIAKNKDVLSDRKEEKTK